MRRFGLSANLMSLGGLAIAIGMLVDAAVVVVENIEAAGRRPARRTLPQLHVDLSRGARGGACRWRPASLIIVIVFLPLLTLQGLEGKLFAPVALTIVFALIALAAAVADRDPGAGVVRAEARMHIDEPLAGAHAEPRLLARCWTGRWPRRTPVLIAAVAGAAGWRRRPITLHRQDPSCRRWTRATSSSAREAAVDQPGRTARQLDLRIQQALLAEVPEIERIVARAGSDELGLDPMGLNETDSFLVLKPPATSGACRTRTG